MRINTYLTGPDSKTFLGQWLGIVTRYQQVLGKVYIIPYSSIQYLQQIYGRLEVCMQ